MTQTAANPRSPLSVESTVACFAEAASLNVQPNDRCHRQQRGADAPESRRSSSLTDQALLMHAGCENVPADALQRFADSSVNYALLTTHTGKVRNREIVTGDFRTLDLFAPPLGLPRDVLAEFDDSTLNAPPRKMVLFSRAQIAGALAK